VEALCSVLCIMPKQALMMLLHTLHIYGLEILARQIRQANCQPFRRRRMMSLSAVSMMSLSAVDPWVGTKETTGQIPV
jgi:hypothetical protein